MFKARSVPGCMGRDLCRPCYQENKGMAEMSPANSLGVDHCGLCLIAEVKKERIKYEKTNTGSNLWGLYFD